MLKNNGDFLLALARKIIMGFKIDLSGQVFNRLTVNYYVGNGKWSCTCVCSNIVNVRSDCLKNGNTKSCGCLIKEGNGTKHKFSKTNEYKIWCYIKQRCYNKNHNEYPNYGGRGITMCDEWLNNPEKFCNDVGKRPSKNHSIDRIDVNGNYELNNVRWATNEEQCNNKRNNRFITFNDRTQTLSQWSRETGIPITTILNRLVKNYPIEELFLPSKKVGKNAKKHKRS